MKKIISILLVILVMPLAACSFSKEKEQSVFDKMQECSVALMESSNGVKVYVWNTMELASLSSFEIENTPLEPADKEDEWLYRIIYNPKDIVSNVDEIVVSFHRDYIQIGSEYYLPKQGVKFSDILEWAESKFEYLIKEYGAE